MIQIYDSLSQSKVELIPQEPNHIRMYVCGPTVYNLFHVGNACPLVIFDLVFRHLKERGYQVTYVRNITDIDDKIIAKANELGESPQAFAQRFTAEFQNDVQALGCLPPTVEPKATETIAEMIRHIEGLIHKRVAYAVEGDVYFSVRNFPEYGRLTRLSLDELRTGARIEPGEHKRDPADFALWKAAKPGEPFWDSPWGKGRPGWHIECSAMAEKFLGVTFDLHGGGIDLRFPHHENEIAQSQGLHGVATFARHWMHNGHIGFRWVHAGKVIAEGSKISKSDTKTKHLYDSFIARHAILRYGGEAVRWFLLSTHYRTPASFDVDLPPDFIPGDTKARLPSLEEAERKLEYGYLTIQKLEEALALGKSAETGPVLAEAESWLHRLQTALDDDFNSPVAFAELQQALALTNRLLENQTSPPPSKDVKRRTLERLYSDLKQAAKHVGIFESRPEEWLNAHRIRRIKAKGLNLEVVQTKIREREEARTQKDYAQSDALRQELFRLGVEVMDTPKGTRWRVAD